MILGINGNGFGFNLFSLLIQFVQSLFLAPSSISLLWRVELLLHWMSNRSYHDGSCHDAISITIIFRLHYGDVIMGAIASQITSLTIVYSTVYSDAVKENIKALRHWPLCGKFTGDRWIPRTNGQLRGKCFHLMTSSCEIGAWISDHTSHGFT